MTEPWARYVHVRSRKFAPIPGEDDELVNPGTYGKALCSFLKERLSAKGHEIPYYCAEDWGWWLDVRDDPVKGGIAVYCGKSPEGGVEYACCLGFKCGKRWSWKKFRTEDISPQLNGLFHDLREVFESDPDVEFVGIAEEMPVETYE